MCIKGIIDETAFWRILYLYLRICISDLIKNDLITYLFQLILHSASDKASEGVDTGLAIRQNVF